MIEVLTFPIGRGRLAVRDYGRMCEAIPGRGGGSRGGGGGGIIGGRLWVVGEGS